MALGKESHLSMKRIVWIAVLAIILPSLVLTLVGLKLTLSLKSRLGQWLADQYASETRAKVEEIEDRVAALEARARRAADRLDPEGLQPALEALERQSPLVDQIFLFDDRLTMLYPPEPEAAPVVAETLLWSEPFPPAVRKAHQTTDPVTVARAIEAVRRFRDRTASPATRARATQAIAALLFRYGQYEAAVTEYKRLLQGDNVAVFSPSLAVLARYQIAAAARRLDRAQEAVSVLLDLYADLVREQTRMADATRIQWFKQRCREDLEVLLARPEVPRPESRRYAALTEEDARRAERKRLLAYLREVVLRRLKLEAPSLRPEDEGFRHLYDEFAGRRYVVAYAAVRAPDERRRILGFSLDLDHLQRELLPATLRSERFGRRVAFVVADRKDRVIYGEGGGRSLAARVPFPQIFEGWHLGLVERRPAELRDLARRNVTLFAFVTSAMIVAIILGVIITLRGTARELELSQLKSDFVSNVSHELKTPLALIRMFAETLEMGRVKDPEKLSEYYSIITRESERLTQLINNVLDFSRIEGGRKTYDMRVEDVADVVHDALHAYSYELDKQDFDVETEIPDDLPETLMDRNAISLAVLNLLSNAVKYSADDKRIRVACWASDGFVRIAVEDHGIGLDAEQAEKVFDKFYRARDDRVDATRGSGLGLAIVRHSIEAHGGTITVDSEKGAGSTFTLALPMRKTPAEEQRRRNA
ncbi:MAG: sensor histidine kinase [Planctomycetota bacterium]